jgi:hypothetical protein
VRTTSWWWGFAPYQEAVEKAWKDAGLPFKEWEGGVPVFDGDFYDWPRAEVIAIRARAGAPPAAPSPVQTVGPSPPTDTPPPSRTNRVIQRLRDCPVGGAVSYQELEEIVGETIRSGTDGYYYQHQARKKLAKEGITFKPVSAKKSPIGEAGLLRVE